jgi:hypothetical protein
MKVRIFSTVVLFAAVLVGGCEPKQKTYATPEAAVENFIKAAEGNDPRALLKVLGQEAEPLVNSGDAVEDKNSRDSFVQSFKTAHSLDTSDPERVTLEVGEDRFPFPIPVVRTNGRWRFDSTAGADELINRRIGANELDTIQSCLAYVDAQREFYVRNAQQDPLLHFADKLISTEEKKDGLYWPTDGDEPPSPLGEAFAAARAEGYLQDGAPKKGTPYHGYIYRMLTKQGEHAPGGAYDYLVDGKLLGGFAAIAFPAEYGNSGVMTFIVNHDGAVYSRDLGADTAKLAMQIESFDPGPEWQREEGVIIPE